MAHPEGFDSSLFPPPLSGVVGRTDVGHLAAADSCRAYLALLNSTATMRGMPDSSSKTIRYFVGRRSMDNHTAQLTRDVNCVNGIQSPVVVTEVISTAMQAFQKKNSAFPAKWDRMDLAPIGNQLARALALFTLNGRITAADLRGGQPFVMRNHLVSTESVGLTRGTVFIPRQATVEAGSTAFTALCSAANAFGVTVYTDVVDLDHNNNVRMPTAQGAQLARGIVQALRILLSMYSVAKQGAVMALAIVKGIHEVMSVHGHTDEGGLMRDVLRRGEYMAPFGGIYTDVAEGFQGLPTGSALQPSTFSAIVDAIALKSAGLVALCDPLVLMRGKAFPTVIVDQAIAESAPGSSVASDAAGGQRMSALFFEGFGTFAQAYTGGLSWLFGVEGGYDVCTSTLSRMAGSLAGVGSRHFEYSAIAPYFWVEPTSLFRNVPETTACAKGFGVVCGAEETVTKRWFESVDIIEDRGLQFLASVEMTCPRKSGLMLHLWQHRQDGVANMIPMQFDKNAMCLVGGLNRIEAKRLGNESLDSYMWGRGHSDLPAPAEVLYTGSRLGIRCVAGTFNATTAQFTQTHFPMSRELLTGSVSFTATRPSAIGVMAPGANPRGVRRARDRATAALADAARAVRVWAESGGESWGISDIEPPASTRDMSAVVGVGIDANAPAPGQIIDPPRQWIQGPPVAGIIHDGPMRPQARARVAGVAIAVAPPVLAGGGQGPPPPPGPPGDAGAGANWNIPPAVSGALGPRPDAPQPAAPGAQPGALPPIE